MRTFRTWLLILAAVAMAASVVAQDADTPKPATAHITGTVTDVNDDTVPGATVVLESSVLKEPRTVVSNDNGFFEFGDLDPGTYNVNVSAEGFGSWNSPPVLVAPGQYVILTGSRLKIAEAVTKVSVVYTPEEAAKEQVKVEEQQRVFGFIPNFYVVYDKNPAPLTTQLKFHLALRTSTDMVTILGIGVLAGMNQAGDTPNYVQGWKGYGERVGAVAADGFSDIIIGGAILPSLLHQDPRYYYKGTGTNKSRVFHALASPFVCRGDNGRLQFNYSSIGGDLGSASLSNLYYPASNRGAGLVFQHFFMATSERMLSSVVQEFVLHRLTTKPKYQ